MKKLQMFTFVAIALLLVFASYHLTEGYDYPNNLRNNAIVNGTLSSYNLVVYGIPDSYPSFWFTQEVIKARDVLNKKFSGKYVFGNINIPRDIRDRIPADIHSLPRLRLYEGSSNPLSDEWVAELRVVPTMNSGGKKATNANDVINFVETYL